VGFLSLTNLWSVKADSMAMSINTNSGAMLAL
jgi:hypothetical protein